MEYILDKAQTETDEGVIKERGGGLPMQEEEPVIDCELRLTGRRLLKLDSPVLRYTGVGGGDREKR